MHNALWQRAVREHQRLRGTDGRAADDAVTVAVNQLGFLQEKAPWFTANLGLRAAALDETARHAMLGDTVPSEPAQDAWDRYWSEHLAWMRLDPQAAERLAQGRNRETLADYWLRAWARWATTA